jgi:hypothetical protein
MALPSGKVVVSDGHRRNGKPGHSKETIIKLITSKVMIYVQMNAKARKIQEGNKRMSKHALKNHMKHADQVKY